MITSILGVLLTFGLVIFLHEFGHFIVCVKLGVRVERFAFGFGPELVGMTRGDTRFSICAIPLGGFVKPAGESLEDATGDPDEYFSRSPWERLMIVAAGPAMNYVLAFVMFFLLAFFHGLPKASQSPVIGDLIKDGPAMGAGLKVGDKIVKINDVDVASWDDLAGTIHKNPEKPVTVVYVRDKEPESIQVTPRLDSASGRGIIGIAPEVEYDKKGFLGSIKHGGYQCWFLTAYTVKELAGKLLAREKPDLAGPLGIVQMVSRAARSGIADLVFLIGLISVAIGFFNILPIPLLDGGHGVLYLWEGISGKKLTTRLVAAANSVGLVFLLSLLIFATWNDVLRIRDQRRASKASVENEKASKSAEPAPAKKP